MMNPQALKKLQKMQEDLKNVQNEINESTFYGQSGGSAVKVAVKGTKEVVSIDIDKDAVDKDDVAMLEDLIIAALNDAFKKVDKETEETLGSITSGMNMPGMF